MKLKKFNYKSVISTNNIAIKLIKKKKIKKGIVFADKQTNGRGQYGRKWISYKGNLFVTVFFSIQNFNLTIKQLTKKNANLIIKLLSQYYDKGIKLKIPNDIMINKKKICGILQEIIVHNNNKYLLVGIGINIIKNPLIKGYPTTNLYDLTKSHISLKKISLDLKRIYEKFLKQQKVY